MNGRWVYLFIFIFYFALLLRAVESYETPPRGAHALGFVNALLHFPVLDDFRRRYCSHHEDARKPPKRNRCQRSEPISSILSRNHYSFFPLQTNFFRKNFVSGYVFICTVYITTIYGYAHYNGVN